MSSPAKSLHFLNAGRRVFISYAREDTGYLEEIREGISALHHEAWIDSNLDGGQSWWDVILEQIRICDAMVLVLSPNLLESEAAARERGYASQLGKPLIPLVVQTVRSDLVPPDIARLQFIDYTKHSPLTGAQLANALYSVRTHIDLPDPLPEPPAVPVSYLGDMANVLRKPELSADEQFSIAAKLRASLERPREHDAAVELLRMLENRRDLFHQTAKEIERIWQEQTQRQLRQDSTQEPARASQSGSQRHVPVTATSGAGPGTDSGQKPAIGRQDTLPVEPPPAPERKPSWSPADQPPANPQVVYPQHAPWANSADQQPAPSPNQAPSQPQFFQAVPPRRHAQQPQAQPYQGQQQWPQLPVQAAQYPAMPAQHLTLSVIALVLSIALGAVTIVLILFIPIGAAAVYFASQVSKRWRMGNHSGALAASKRALVWGWIGVAVSGLWFLAYMVSYASLYG